MLTVNEVIQKSSNVGTVKMAMQIPPREMWETLRDVLWRKYQRKRCPWELIEAIDKLLEEDDF